MATIHIRTDAETDKALAELAPEGTNQSEAIREAIKFAARQLRRERMRAEAEALAANPDDLAEIRRVREDMESYRAW